MVMRDGQYVCRCRGLTVRPTEERSTVGVSACSHDGRYMSVTAMNDATHLSRPYQARFDRYAAWIDPEPSNDNTCHYPD